MVQAVDEFFPLAFSTRSSLASCVPHCHDSCNGSYSVSIPLAKTPAEKIRERKQVQAPDSCRSDAPFAVAVPTTCATTYFHCTILLHLIFIRLAVEFGIPIPLSEFDHKLT